MQHLRSILFVAVLVGACDGLRLLPVASSRRSVVAAAAAAALAPGRAEAVPPTFVAGKQRQGLGQFVKAFNNAVLAGDVAAVQDALKLFDLAVDEETARITIESSKLPVASIASDNLPVIVEMRSGLTSAKVTMRGARLAIELGT
jgi:hypothetical protein